MIAAVIFDYGNVLSQSLDIEPRAAWERKLGLASGELERMVHNDSSWIEAQCGRLPVEAHWQHVGRALGLTLPETADLRAAFYLGEVCNHELVARIDHMRSAGLRLGLLSNFSTELRLLLRKQGLLHRFDHIAISAEIGVMKPHAAAYEAVLNRLEVPARACVFIDDQLRNVEAAQALGLHGIVFHDNASCLSALGRLLASQ
jgi:putative hydrolase of the HAD superfamily